MDAPKATTQYLPPELIDLILEELRPDGSRNLPSHIRDSPSEAEADDDFTHPNHDLASCALVCRDWRELSRRHLFHAMSFSFKPDSKQLIAYEENTGESIITDYQRSLKTLDMLATFLEDNPHIAQYVATLTLYMDPFNNLIGTPYRSKMYYSPLPSVLGRISSALSPRLEAMEFCNVILDEDAFDNEPHAWTGVFPPIDSVVLQYDLRSRVGKTTISNILTFFSSIGSLVLDDLCLWDDNIGEGAVPNHLKITNLVLRDTSIIEQLVPMGSINQPLKEIYSLAFELYQKAGEADLESMNDLLSECGDHLEEFSADLFPVDTEDLDPDDEPFSFDFSECHRLERIIFSLPVYPVGYANYSELNRDTWDSLITTFLEYPPPNLKNLELMIEQGSGRLKEFEWNTPEILELEGVLLRLSSLERVRLTPWFEPDNYAAKFTGDEDPERVEEDASYDTSNFSSDSWLDPEFAMKLFAGMLLTSKLWVCGENSFHPRMCMVAATPEMRSAVPPAFFAYARDVMKEARRRRKIHLQADALLG